MFCRRHDGGFTSREHAFPESLGNTTVIAPRGVVCDRCNHGPLADVEQELIRFLPVAFLRVLLGHTNKKGERPVAKGNNATWSSPTENHIVINAENDTAFRVVEQIGPWTKFNVNLTTGGPISQARWPKITRALWKATLECAYLDHGEMIYEERFDEVREMTLGTRKASGFLITPKKIEKPTTEMSLKYYFVETDSGPAMPSVTVIGGVPFMTDLFARKLPLDSIHRALLEGSFNIVEF
jgi:hypothetical protein